MASEITATQANAFLAPRLSWARTEERGSKQLQAPLRTETQSLIHRALEHGWLRKPDAPEIKPESYLRRETRANWHARGLNSAGKPRRNTPHPDLAGLNRKTYHREYMRRWRDKMTNDE